MRLAVQRPQTDRRRRRTHIDKVIAVTKELRPKMAALSGGGLRNWTAFGGHPRQTSRAHGEKDDVARTPGRTSERPHRVRDGLHKAAGNADLFQTVPREEPHPLSIGGPERG